MSYRLLVLPPCTTMTPALLRKIAKPGGSRRDGRRPTPAEVAESVRLSPVRRGSEAACRRAVGRLRWKSGERTRLRPGQDRLRQVARRDSRGDGASARFRVRQSPAGISISTTSTARRATTDIYFVSNQRDFSAEAECTFRVSGKTPELWHPDSGRIEKAAVYAEKDGRTTVPLSFDRDGLGVCGVSRQDRRRRSRGGREAHS